MRLFTPEKTILMEIDAVKPHPEGLLIEGKIMGAMPLRAVLPAAELRAGFRLLNWGVVGAVLRALFRRSAGSS